MKNIKLLMKNVLIEIKDIKIRIVMFVHFKF